MVLLSYAAVDLAWRNGAIALGIAALVPLGWQLIHHERRHRQEMEDVEGGTSEVAAGERDR
jgi:hypothetical protein